MDEAALANPVLSRRAGIAATPAPARRPDGAAIAGRGAYFFAAAIASARRRPNLK